MCILTGGVSLHPFMRVSYCNQGATEVSTSPEAVHFSSDGSSTYAEFASMVHKSLADCEVRWLAQSCASSALRFKQRNVLRKLLLCRDCCEYLGSSERQGIFAFPLSLQVVGLEQRSSSIPYPGISLPFSHICKEIFVHSEVLS
jgi:hypothetical protein